MVAGDGSVRLWPVPDLSRRPLHTLPYDELMARLKALTNLRAVADDQAEPPIEADGRTLVAVWAGSLGATRINTAVNELSQLWADRDDMKDVSEYVRRLRAGRFNAL